MAEVKQRVVHVDGVRVFFRQVAGNGPPVLFVHGHPTHSEDWQPFLERLEVPAVALDLPGWGASTQRRPGFDGSMNGLARFLERFCTRLAIDEYSLCVHDAGAVALIAAQRQPERVRRLALINALPLLEGYRWHWIVRWFWRVAFLGEPSNATATEARLRPVPAQASVGPGPLADELIESAYSRRPPGQWPAALELYRSTDPGLLAAAGARLGELRCPALVAWGLDDPYLPPEFAAAYAERLPGAELIELEGAGHWPWLDRPELVDRVVAFFNQDR